MNYRRLLCCVLLVMGFAFAKAQSKKASLEAQKAQIQREINQFSRLLKNVKQEASTVVLLVQTLDKKIKGTQQIINITNRQANAITRSIKNNEAQIAKLKEEIKVQKEAYAQMIVKSYQSRNKQSRLMFLLSSEDFLQAYKRLQYLKSYADYRRKQAAEIRLKSEQLIKINETLELEKKEKQQILAFNKKQQQALKNDKINQESLLAQVRTDEKKYVKQIRAAEKERTKLDRELRRLIAADIARANKGKKGAVKNKYFLSPEAKALATSFVKNKGKLPYPVDEFIITRTFGEQPHPVLPGIKVYCPGFMLQAPAGATVKAIFKGKVNRIEKSRNGILTVHVRHGNYTSIYRNLKSVNVKTGDQVDTQETLGVLFTNKAGVTEMTFVLMEDTKNVDPSRWVMSL